MMVSITCSHHLFANSNLSPLAIRADGMDPDLVTGDFSKRLQQMGIADPNPTYSPSSTAFPQAMDGPSQPLGPAFPSARTNATPSVLEARRQLQQEAEEDFEAMGRSGSQGRRFVDMRTLVEAMQMRERGAAATDIERRLQLQPNLLEKLGRQSIVSHMASTGN